MGLHNFGGKLACCTEVQVGRQSIVDWVGGPSDTHSKGQCPLAKSSPHRGEIQKETCLIVIRPHSWYPPVREY